jgi:hypothetical protein
VTSSTLRYQYLPQPVNLRRASALRNDTTVCSLQRQTHWQHPPPALELALVYVAVFKVDFAVCVRDTALQRPHVNEAEAVVVGTCSSGTKHSAPVPRINSFLEAMERRCSRNAVLQHRRTYQSMRVLRTPTKATVAKVVADEPGGFMNSRWNQLLLSNLTLWR